LRSRSAGASDGHRVPEKSRRRLTSSLDRMIWVHTSESTSRLIPPTRRRPASSANCTWKYLSGISNFVVVRLRPAHQSPLDLVGRYGPNDDNASILVARGNRPISQTAHCRQSPGKMQWLRFVGSCHAQNRGNRPICRKAHRRQSSCRLASVELAVGNHGQHGAAERQSDGPRREPDC